MNETQTDKKPAPGATAEPKLTRIAVKHLYFAENTDLPGGNSQLSNQKTFRDPPEARRYFMCDFIPAWQQFELTYFADANTTTPPIVELLPACHIRRWTRL